MINDILVKIIKPAKRLPLDIDHFSIEKIGSRFYLYAHPLQSGFNKKKIGTFPDYESAKAMVDSILDMKLPHTDL